MDHDGNEKCKVVIKFIIFETNGGKGILYICMCIVYGGEKLKELDCI